MKTVTFLLLLFLNLASCQHCADDCRIVCGNDNNRVFPSSAQNGPSAALTRGKQGPKGQKGEAGPPGEPGDFVKSLEERMAAFEEVAHFGEEAFDLVSKMEEKVKRLKNFVYKVMGKQISKTCGLGVQDRSKVADSRLTSGSQANSNTKYLPKHGRLFSTTGAGAWCGRGGRKSGVIHDDLWVQADFGGNVVAEGVVTQGRHSSGQWVTSYRVRYKKDGEDHFQTVLDENNQPKNFQGNADGDTPVINRFEENIRARYFRIHVVEFYKHPSMRFDFIMC